MLTHKSWRTCFGVCYHPGAFTQNMQNELFRQQKHLGFSQKIPQHLLWDDTTNGSCMRMQL